MSYKYVRSITAALVASYVFSPLAVQEAAMVQVCGQHSIGCSNQEVQQQPSLLPAACYHRQQPLGNFGGS
jgi:hypothetical protein